MTVPTNTSKTLNIILWISQILIAILLLSGTFIKFMPIEKVAAMMPWTGEVPVWAVRLLGVIDLLGAIGLILPAALGIKRKLVAVTALCIVLLMISAIVFHVARNEASSIGINIFTASVAAFIAWGRSSKASIRSKQSTF